MRTVRESLNIAQQRLSKTAFSKISLKNHLCLVALREGCGENYHLGIIVRAIFESFFLAKWGYGTLDLAMYSEVGDQLGSFYATCTRGCSIKLNHEIATSVGRLLAVFDSQLSNAPMSQLLAAYEHAESNFNAVPEERRSINSLVAMEQVRRMYQRRAEPPLIVGSAYQL